jgi:type I restriction enzyme S subunit
MLGRLLRTAQPSIKVGHMTSIEVIIPEAKTIIYFSEVVETLFKRIEVNYRQIQTLTKTRDALLPKLMSGQIRVKEGESIIEEE